MRRTWKTPVRSRMTFYDESKLKIPYVEKVGSFSYLFNKATKAAKFKYGKIVYVSELIWAQLVEKRFCSALTNSL